jgi:hypothetical protein
MLALAAERAVERFRCRIVVRRRARKRRCGGRMRSGRLDLGGQDVPVFLTERLRNQFETFAVGGFDSLLQQRIAQGVRHRLRIAKIAHESTSSSTNGKIGTCLADPFANGEATGRS